MRRFPLTWPILLTTGFANWTCLIALIESALFVSMWHTATGTPTFYATSPTCETGISISFINYGTWQFTDHPLRERYLPMSSVDSASRLWIKRGDEPCACRLHGGPRLSASCRVKTIPISQVEQGGLRHSYRIVYLSTDRA